MRVPHGIGQGVAARALNDLERRCGIPIEPRVRAELFRTLQAMVCGMEIDAGKLTHFEIARGLKAESFPGKDSQNMQRSGI